VLPRLNGVQVGAVYLPVASPVSGALVTGMCTGGGQPIDVAPRALSRAGCHPPALASQQEAARSRLITSANLTSRAMETNLECGILIRGGPQPRAIRDHITGLQAHGYLCQ
jgi:hypothetical protein